MLFILFFTLFVSLNCHYVSNDYIKERHLSTTPLSVAPRVKALPEKSSLEKIGAFIKNVYFPTFVNEKSRPPRNNKYFFDQNEVSQFYNFLEKKDLLTSPLSNQCAIDIATADSLELLRNSTLDNTTGGFIDAIGYSFTATMLGKIYFSHIVCTPIIDNELLQQRQVAIQTLFNAQCTNQQLSQDLTHALATIQKSETTLLTFLTKEQPANPVANTRLNSSIGGGLYFNFDLPFLKYLNKLNSNVAYNELIWGIKRATLAYYIETGEETDPLTLTIGHIYSSISSLLYTKGYTNFDYFAQGKQTIANAQQVCMKQLHLPEFIAKLCHRILAGAYLTQQISTYSYVHECSTHIAALVKAIQTIDQLIEQNPELNIFDEITRNTLKLEHGTGSKLDQLVQLLNTSTFDDVTIFSRQGRAAAAFAMLQENASDFLPALYAVAQLDAFNAFATNMTTCKNIGINNWSKATFLQSQKPVIQANKVWNVCIKNAMYIAIPNSIELGTANNPYNNLVLSGPNAGGKSTFLKSIIYATICAQTFGYAPADSFAFTPFTTFFSSMNIADNIGTGDSKFQSELNRANDLATALKVLQPHEFCFAMLDELFVGTAPKVAEDLSYKTALHYASSSNCMVLFATHYEKNKLLEEETGLFKNYFVEILRHEEDNSFTRTYKIKPGTTTENVAMEMAQNSALFNE